MPVYWGWLLAPGIPTLVCAMLDRSQMGLIFDLDETLLVAHSVSTAEGRVESCLRARCCLESCLFVKQPLPRIQRLGWTSITHNAHLSLVHRTQMLESLEETDVAPSERCASHLLLFLACIHPSTAVKFKTPLHILPAFRAQGALDADS